MEPPDEETIKRVRAYRLGLKDTAELVELDAVAEELNLLFADAPALVQGLTSILENKTKLHTTQRHAVLKALAIVNLLEAARRLYGR